jgi:hypothetical protein
VGSCEYGDEPSSSGAMDLVSLRARPLYNLHFLHCISQVRTRADLNYVVHANVDDETELVCSVCRRRVPPRTFHCRICQACVVKRDHHCVWYDFWV